MLFKKVAGEAFQNRKIPRQYSFKGTTILIGWVMTPDYVIDEMQRNGETFRRKKLYRVMIRYVAPVMMLVLFLQSTGILA